MKNLKFIYLFLLSLFVSSHAVYVAVLETGADGEAKELVKFSDRQYLTNVFREEAVKQLPAVQNYTIMTRENINAMLPPGKAIEDCEGTCLAETGKNIAADYICQARVGRFGNALTLSAELYETAGNKLVASFNGRGADVNALLDLIKTNASGFFGKIKEVRGGGFNVYGGIGEVGSSREFSYSGSKKFIVEIETNPAGAVPTIDGKAVPKCLNTPCVVQIEAGSHRFVASKENYDDAESVVDIKTNNQKVQLELVPNFGWIELKPELKGGVANKGTLSVTVDGEQTTEKKVQLAMGLHDVRLSHPCYDPAEFKVVIAKNKTETLNKVMERGVGAMELVAEYKGEPQAVAVFIDGVESGSTPYSGVVPLCAEVTLKGNGWSEKVDVKPVWHEVVQVTHKLSHAPNGLPANNVTRLNAQVAYDELDDKNLKNGKVGSSVPANVGDEKPSRVHWVPLSISAAVAVVGGAMAVVFNKKAKDATATPPANEAEFKKGHDDSGKYQTVRNISLGLAALGVVGVGVTFLF